MTIQQPDAEWRAKILAIQERATAAAESTSEQHNGFKVLRKGCKRTKLSLIPDVHTYHANEVCDARSTAQTTAHV
jgi:centromere protein I